MEVVVDEGFVLRKGMLKKDRCHITDALWSALKKLSG